MKKILLLTTVTALLSSCGIYTKYQPETTAPDNLFGDLAANSEKIGNLNITPDLLDTLVKRDGEL